MDSQSHHFPAVSNTSENEAVSLRDAHFADTGKSRSPEPFSFASKPASEGFANGFSDPSSPPPPIPSFANSPPQAFPPPYVSPTAKSEKAFSSSFTSPGDPPALPSRDGHAGAPPLPARKRQPFFLNGNRGRSQTVTSVSSGSVFNAQRASFSSTANYDLLLSRLDAKEGQAASSLDVAEGPGSTKEGLNQLKIQFYEIRSGLQTTTVPSYEIQPDGMEDPTSIDWEFWLKVVDDYASLARNNPVDLSLAIASGVPHELRGVIWQVISASRSQYLEELYSSIVSEPSPHEKAIRRDLSRTSFIKHVDSESLFKIIKAYSLFDPAVGYTQGMAFITVPLLINLPESEAFCLLVKLMKDYGLREFFLYEMPGLHLRLYQFDRILEDTLPDVHIHLSRQGVRSSMFASQWFLTLFAYKFPLQIVLRIFDVVMAEGIEAMLRFAVGLVRRNAAAILSLEFESLLTFLKENIFDFYILDRSLFENVPVRGGSPIVRGNSSPPHPHLDTSTYGGTQYRANDLVADAYDIKILPVTLQKYTDEYNELNRIERERVEEVEAFRSSNGQLTQKIRRLESTVAGLTNEHLVVTNDLAHERIKTAQLQDENEELSATKQALEMELKEKLSDLGEGAAEEVIIDFIINMVIGLTIIAGCSSKREHTTERNQSAVRITAHQFGTGAFRHQQSISGSKCPCSLSISLY